MTSLKDRLQRLSDRGTPIGSSSLRDRVVADLAGRATRGPRSWSLRRHDSPVRRPVVVALTAAALTLVSIGLIGVVPLLNGDRSGVVDQPSATAPAVLPTTLPGTVPATPFTLEAAPDLEPVRVSTVLGDIDFTMMRVVSDDEFVSFRGLAASPHGLVAVDGETLLWSADHETWHRVAGDLDAMQVVVAGDDVFVSGETSLTRLAWEGDQWIRRERIDFSRGFSGPVAAGTRGVVVVAADGAEIYASSDGVTFAVAERPPRTDVFVAMPFEPEEEDRDLGDCRAAFGATRSQIRHVVATDDGFVALTSAEHPYGWACDPLLWFSSDGNVWDLVSTESPFGTLSVVGRGEPGGPVTEYGGRFLAFGEVGGQGIVDPIGAVWVSDDALTWQRVDVELNTVISVSGNELGWLLVGAADEEGFHMWFSTDGIAWDGPHPLPEGSIGGYFAPQFVVGADAIVAFGTREQVFFIGRIQN